MSRAQSGAIPDLSTIVKTLDRIGRKANTHGMIAQQLTGFKLRQRSVAKDSRQFFRYTWDAHFDKAIAGFCKLVDPTPNALTLKYLLKQVQKSPNAQLRKKANADLISLKNLRNAKYEIIYKERNQRLSHEDAILYVDPADLTQCEIDGLREKLALSFTPAHVCDALEDCRKLLEPYYAEFEGPPLSWLPGRWNDLLNLEKSLSVDRPQAKYM